jgi:hypothetical protein
MIGLFKGLDPLIPSSLPTSSLMYEIGDANTRYFVYDLRKEGTYVVYFFVKNMLKNGGTY